MWTSFYIKELGLSCSMWDLLVVVCELSCGMWDPVPRPRIEPRLPALGAQSLSHWTSFFFFPWLHKVSQLRHLGSEDLLWHAGPFQFGHASSLSWHVRSSSLTGDWTGAPCIGTVEFEPLGHQGSPWTSFYNHCLWEDWPWYLVTKNIYFGLLSENSCIFITTCNNMVSTKTVTLT